MNALLEHLESAISQNRQAIVEHTLYNKLTKLEHVQIFMEHHVYAVFDFMSLLKSLQQNLTCTSIPWLPKGNANTRYLINEIVCGEESDTDASGKRMSHFEMYLEAMEQAGANTQSIRTFIAAIKDGASIEAGFEIAATPPAARQFMSTTFDIIYHTNIATQTAVFTYGREDLIPNMFHVLVSDINNQFPNKIDKFKYYLDRHIEVDGDHHKILAKEMLLELLPNEQEAIVSIIKNVQKSLEARKVLWKGIEEIIIKTKD